MAGICGTLTAEITQIKVDAIRAGWRALTSTSSTAQWS
jgi:hypothetical protein